MTFEGAIGQWWLGEWPESRKFSGWLESSATGWRLTFDGQPIAPDNAPYASGTTFFGVTGHGDFTLHFAHEYGFTQNYGVFDREPVRSASWFGQILIRGAHVSHGQLFREAEFKLQDLPAWIGPTSLNHHNTPPLRFDLAQPVAHVLTADLSTGERITLAMHDSRRTGRRSSNVSLEAQYILESKTGFRLERADRISLALSRLHAIVMSHPVVNYNMTLRTFDENSRRVERLDPEDIEEPDNRSLLDPFIDTTDVHFATFIPRWIDLHEEALAAMAAAAPNTYQGFTTTRLIEVCNGIEHLAQIVMETPSLTAQEEATLEALKSHGFNSPTRRSFRQFLQGRHQTLEMKLVKIAETLGHDSSRWLLGDDLHDWAHSVARLRNAVAHGLKLPDGMFEDIPFTISALRSVIVVLRLGLLRAAGYDAAERTPGELLWVSGERVVAHPNSDLWRELEDLSELRNYWEGWNRRLLA